MAEHVVSDFTTCSGSVRSHRLVFAWAAVLPDVCRKILVEGCNLISIRQMRHKRVSANGQIAAAVLEIERANGEHTFNLFVFCSNALERIIKCGAAVSACRQSKSANRLEINACRTSVTVGNFEFVGTCRAVFHEAIGAKPLGIEPRQKHRLIAHFPDLSPHAHARLVPRARQHTAFAFGAVNGVKLNRHMVLVHSAHGHNHFAHTNVQFRAKTLLQPELLESNLAATLNFSLVLARLVGVNLNRRLDPAVLKLNLGAHCPAAAEVVANINDHVRQVELPVAIVVFVLFGETVAVEVSAVEIARRHGLAVSANS